MGRTGNDLGCGWLISIVYVLFLLSASSLRAEQGQVVDGLQINLSCDKAVYSIGEEVHLRVEFVNHAKRAFRVLELTQFLGDELVVNDGQGNQISLEGGVLTYSPKTNQYTGTTRLIQPGQRHVLKLDALVDAKRRLVFQERREAAPATMDAAFKKRFGLPADYPPKYIGTGRIFPLSKPGKYVLRFLYDDAEKGHRWNIVPDPEENEKISRQLWRGKAASNSIEIEIR